MKHFISILSICFCTALHAQIDTTDIYKERIDTIAAAGVSSGQGNFLSKGKDIRTEVISAAGLCKMACCNLAESFENSASVTVGYSDAVTGARQIRLLGLSGVYTQMLDENRPVMRGLASPFGLNYFPGQWLSSIQIAKGAPSVINGVESITGTINLEHRKPTDELPLFVNASFMSEMKADLNVASSLQLDKQGKWNTVLLGHVSGNFKDIDMNGDTFLDEPRQFQVNFANRWLYYDPSGVQVRFGVRFLNDERRGGQTVSSSENPWQSKILNRNFNAYCKVGVPLNEDNSENVAFIGDFNDYSMGSTFGLSSYDGTQLSGIFNALYQNQVLEQHHFTAGFNFVWDSYKEQIIRKVPMQALSTPFLYQNLFNLGVFGEYTFHAGEKFTSIAGARGDWYRIGGVRISPRLTLKYTPFDQLVLRLNAGRGLRNSCPLTDNIGVFSTGKSFYSNNKPVQGSESAIFGLHPLEDAWVIGGNATVYFPLGASQNAYIGFDYFRTQFVNQMIVDYEHYDNIIDFYMLDGQSYTDTYQLDFSVEPIKRFTVTLTGRYTNARVTLADRGLVEKPMSSRYKAVLNLQYATNLNKWIFDFTASLNGPCRLYSFMKSDYPTLQSPVYPLLYAQITHRMKGWDIYLGGENLTNFTQKNPILNANSPYSAKFDASCIWGPLMGIKAYVGIRVSLWKKS